MPPETRIPPQIRQYIPGGQQFITLIKRHLIGLVYIYLIVIGATAAIVSISAVAAPDLLEGISGQEFSILTLASILFFGLIVFVLILVTNIYLHNTLVITDKETIQILQRGVFQVRVSHLSHADIEDVTADRSGLLATIFDYGTLHIETSGEQRNFVFSYCPRPDRYARVVLEARQRFSETTSG